MSVAVCAGCGQPAAPARLELVEADDPAPRRFCNRDCLGAWLEAVLVI